MKGHAMKSLQFDISHSGATLSGFIEKDTIFRTGIKEISAQAQVTLSFYSTGEVTGCVQILSLHLSALQNTVDQITTYISTEFPTANITYTYHDSEDE